MAFTPDTVIQDVRRLVQDSTIPYRYSDTHMLGVFNQAMKRLCVLRPDLFAYITTMNLVAGTIQTAPADCYRVIDLLLDAAGNNVNEINREALDLMFNTWQTGAQGSCTNWMRHVRNPVQFFVYPPSANNQQVTIEYAQVPRSYAQTDAVTLPSDAFYPALMDCCVWLIESVDNEHANSGRAKMFYDSFIQQIGLSAQNKNVTDDDSGNENPQETY